MRDAPLKRHWMRSLMLGGAAVLVLGLFLVSPTRGAAGHPATLPEFAHHDPASWINSPPLTKAGLRGKVVLLEVYTSG